MRSFRSWLSILAVLALWVAPADAVVTSPTSASGPYACTGTQTAFLVGFRFLANTDLVVTRTSPTGTVTTLTLATDYTAAGAGSATGGTVTLVAAARCPATYTLSIKRVVSLTQTTALTTQGTFSPKVHEAAFDRLTMAAQQLERTHGEDKATQGAKDSAQDTSIAAESSARASTDASILSTVATNEANLRHDLDGAPGSTIDSWTVQSTGSTTSRSLAVRFAEAQNVKDFGAKGDNTTDDTAAVAAAYAAAAAGGGTVYFPPGRYKMNLTVTHANIRVLGAGRSLSINPSAGTVLRPQNLTKPVLQIGDGTTANVKYVTFGGFTVQGDGAWDSAGTSTSDGIVILGAADVVGSDFSVDLVGGDSVRITSSATRATSYVQLANFTIDQYSRNALNVIYGATFVTAVNLSNFAFYGPSYSVLSQRSVRCEGVALRMANGWIETMNGAGVLLVRDAAGHDPALIANGVAVDSPNSTDVLVELDTPWQRWPWPFVQGNLSIDGKLKWLVNAALIDMTSGGSGLYPSDRRTPYWYVTSRLAMGVPNNNSGTTYDERTAPLIYLDATDDSVAKDFTKLRLQLHGSAFQGSFTYANPVFFGASGALWRNATTSGLRYKGTGDWPTSDTDGAPVATLVAAPANAGDACSPGQMAADATYVYVCTATNAWKRAPIAAW